MNILKGQDKLFFFKNVKFFTFYKKNNVLLQNKLRLKDNNKHFLRLLRGRNFFISRKNENNVGNNMIKEDDNSQNENKNMEFINDTIKEECEDKNNIKDKIPYEDEEEDDDKYIKSFYEIYDDNNDTYDCPKELLRFIKKEFMNIKIKIKCSSPRNLKKNDVKNIINDMFEESENILNDNLTEKKKNEESNYDIYYLNSSFKEFNYPDKNVMWPNPLIYNHRLQPFVLKKKKNELNENFELDKKNIEINKKRLENLWRYSSSYGVDWNTLDELYLNFKKHKTEHLNDWENNKNKIMLYASKVCKRKLIKSRKQLLDKLNINYSSNIYANYDENEQLHETNLDDDQTEYNLLLPRSIFRRWIRTLYFYWKDRYMHYYNNTLCDYLKGEIVDMQLLREHNERNLNLSNKKMLNQHSFSLKPVKGSNLYITRYIKKKKINVKYDNDNEYDLTGIGEHIYNNAQKEK
ncbi:conserved Plasmodium protein, unknown function [Plasmodium gallinaceum]|uniref:Uncharacterized protein n=1 Tax=Plasmodium gallinaceum TaxID=5849 RepID=A0A1J1H0R4_PLAGA|nr:conserved Plasmodium protein, unknown function [Plasmodium gallinaceum]CRG98155.1 conserved Plasmodium protein, unknown function [Plasmodium gallinaceum]